MESVKLIECPRDAWQGLKHFIPTERKVEYLRALIAAGFKHIDAVSFVSPKAVPQMADSEDVLKKLDPPDDVDIIGIVVNDKGAERAVNTEAVQTLGFPYSVSPTFLERNQKQTLEDAIDELEKIGKRAYDAGLDVVEAVGILADMGIQQVSLADTVGTADEPRIRELVEAVISKHDHIEIGVH